MKRVLVSLVAFTCVCATFLWAQTASEFKGHDNLVYNIAFSNDGKTFATASFDGTVKIWDYSTGKEIRALKVSKEPVYGVSFNNDGSVLATCGDDKAIRFWNPKDGKLIKELPKAHANIVQWVAFSPDGKYLASASTDKTVKLWDAKEGKELKSFTGHKDSVYSVAFNKDGTQFASCGNDGLVKIYDVKGMNEIKSMMVDLPKKEVKIEPKKEEPKDKDKDKKPKKDAGKKEEPKEIRDAFTVVAFSPDGKYVLTGGNDKFLRYWNLADGKEAKKMEPITQYIFGLAISRDGKYVATAGYGGALRVYDAASGNRVYPPKQTDPKKDEESLKAADAARKGAITYCIAFSPDGKSVITGQHELKTGKGIVKVTAIGK
jgi:WD40 repeat protein